MESHRGCGGGWKVASITTGAHGLGSSSSLHIRPPEGGKSHLELEEEDDDAWEEGDNDDAREEEGGSSAT
jgi:hypothetical protein